uniref:Uncharacterized protein n=1 Tax=Glossina palpalis gambiensis TaxID=67801 RepID=A0A1B0AYF6_9MUSC
MFILFYFILFFFLSGNCYFLFIKGHACRRRIVCPFSTSLSLKNVVLFTLTYPSNITTGVWFIPCEVKHNIYIYVILPLVIVAVALPSESSNCTKGYVLGLMGLKVTQVKNIIIICERGCQQCNYQALSERKCFISFLKTLPLSSPSTHHTAAYDSIHGVVGC